MDSKLDMIRGSLIGGAAGDALGYAVEFDSYHRIIDKYGEQGITEYELTNGIAQISDDTQMTLFTANGMLMGLTRGCMRGIGGAPEMYVECAYKDWYKTQIEPYSDEREYGYTWLGKIPAFYARRAPGNTCLTAINAMINGKTPNNDSKGCGGVMRVAPYGLFCASKDRVRYSIEGIDVAGGEIARLTHKHPLGWIPTIVLTHILYRIVKEEGFNGLDTADAQMRFENIVTEALDLLPKLVVKNNVSEVDWQQEKPIGNVFHNDVERQKELIERALMLANSNLSNVDCINRLGEGWVGEEALAIAVFCTARYIKDFEKAIIASVNHNGDSDSTGAVTGNIVGAIVGYNSIPDRFKDHLELHDVILAVADDLHQGCIISEYEEINTPEKQQWFDRYCEMRPAGFEHLLA